MAIEGAILKFDCNYFYNRVAHAHLEVNVVSLPTRSIIYTQSYRTDNKEGGVAAGIFGDPVHLANFAQTTLNQTIDKVLSDPVFISSLSTSVETPGSDSGSPLTDRLHSLDQLKDDGLVSDEKYEATRKELLEQL